jgi:hypothetical protein
MTRRQLIRFCLPWLCLGIALGAAVDLIVRWYIP